MKKALIKILLLEDLLTDVELACDALCEAGLVFETRHVMREPEYRALLETAWPDIIVADYSLPNFDGFTALKLRNQLLANIPFVFLTGSLGEERAVDTLRSGATDYILKENLPRFPTAVLRALAEADAMRDQALMQKELDGERQLLEAVLTTTGALILILDRDGRVAKANPAALHSLRLGRAEAVGKSYIELFATGDEAGNIATQLSRLLDADPADAQHVAWRSTVGALSVQWSAGCLPLPGTRSEYAVLAGIDITHQEEAERQAQFLRHYDKLTGLPNRELLEQRLYQFSGVEGSGRHALVLVGIERLSDIRDSLGIAIGDQLLLDIARRMRNWQQGGDWLARVGDNSFALMLEIQDEAEISAPLQQLLERLRKPHRIGDREFFLPVYLGVALHEAGNSPGDSLQAAETALHRAIISQSEGYQLYQTALSSEVASRLTLEAELRVALQGTGQLEVHYQPQANLFTGQIVGVEALVRWRHPRLGLVPPNEFIPLAEASGLILSLGEQVLRIACHQAAAWQRAGLPALTMAVNLAAAQWAQPTLIDSVEAALAESGLAPQWLELELTETTSMNAPGPTIAMMKKLRAMGVHMSIDDFGTGYCNLSYLKRYPVNKLKIDRSFVSEITSDADDLAIARTVIAIAHQLHLKVVAEGVETEGQLALLAESGCDLIQGYFFSRPLPAAACTALLANGAQLAAQRRQSYNRTLLIVDDDEYILTALRYRLAESGYQVLACNQPMAAFELLAKHEVGVIVADQYMPQMTGNELLNRVKDMYPATVRIILSGQADLQSLAESVNRGAIYKFISKPWDDSELLAALADAFSNYEKTSRTAHNPPAFR